MVGIPVRFKVAVIVRRNQQSDDQRINSASDIISLFFFLKPVLGLIECPKVRGFQLCFNLVPIFPV